MPTSRLISAAILAVALRRLGGDVFAAHRLGRSAIGSWTRSERRLRAPPRPTRGRRRRGSRATPAHMINRCRVDDVADSASPRGRRHSTPTEKAVAAGWGVVGPIAGVFHVTWIVSPVNRVAVGGGRCGEASPPRTATRAPPAVGVPIPCELRHRIGARYVRERHDRHHRLVPARRRKPEEPSPSRVGGVVQLRPTGSRPIVARSEPIRQVTI